MPISQLGLRFFHASSWVPECIAFKNPCKKRYLRCCPPLRNFAGTFEEPRCVSSAIAKKVGKEWPKLHRRDPGVESCKNREDGQRRRIGRPARNLEQEQGCKAMEEIRWGLRKTLELEFGPTTRQRPPRTIADKTISITGKNRDLKRTSNGSTRSLKRDLRLP